MMNPQAAGIGTLSHELNGSGEGGGWPYLKALQAWTAATVQVGTRNSPTPSTSPFVAQREAIKEAAYNDQIRDLIARDSLHPSISGSGTPNKRTNDVLEQHQQQQQPVVGKKVSKPKGSGSTRWETHNKQTCKCAVCMQCRGELKSSWYKHDQLTCACAVCRQFRGASRPKETHRVAGVTGGVGSLCTKHSLPTIPGKRASWVPAQEQQPSTECWACSRELPRYGGLGQQQTQAPFASQQHSTFPSYATVLKSSAASSPLVAGLDSCNTTTGMPMPWSQALTNLAGHASNCSSSVLGYSSVSSPLLAPTPKSTFDAYQEQLACEQKFGFSYRAENSSYEQPAFQTNMHSNPRCSSGWPNSDRSTSSKTVIGNSSDVQQFPNDCLNIRRSCENHAAIPYNCSPGLSWQNVDRCQDLASTGLPGTDSPLFVGTRKEYFPWAQNLWDPLQKTSSAAVTERNGQQCSYSAGSLPDPFFLRGQTSSLLSGDRLPMAHAQPPNTVLHAVAVEEMNNRSVYVPLQSSNFFSDAGSGRLSSVAQFPFGLEVQAQVEHDVHPDLEAPIHAQSISFNGEEDITESSSDPCQTTSISSMVNERDNSWPPLDVDSGHTRCASGPVVQGSPEKLIVLTKDDTWEPVGQGQLHSGWEKDVRQTKATKQKPSKRLVHSDDGRPVVNQKRTKREGVFNPAPKWSQLIQAKYSQPTIMRKICIRSRVLKNCQSAPPNALEGNLADSIENCSAGSLNLPAQDKTLDLPVQEKCLEGRSQLEETLGTGSWESSRTSAVQKVPFVVPEASVAELRENSQESPSCENVVTSPDDDVENNPRDKRIRLQVHRQIPQRLGLEDIAPVVSLAMSCTEVSRDGHGSAESQADEQKAFPSGSDFVSPACGGNTSLMDVSSMAARAWEASHCAINDNLGRMLQHAGPIFGPWCQGKKRPRTELEICGEGEGGTDPSRYPIPEFEGAHPLQPRKKPFKGKSHHGASLSTSLLSNRDYLCTEDLTRSYKSGEMDKVVVEVVLPESIKFDYLTRMLKARSSEVNLWATLFVRDVAQQCTSTHSFVAEGQPSSLCSTVGACSTPSRALLKALKSLFCQRTTGLLTWSEMIGGMRIYSPSSIGKDTEFPSKEIICGSRSWLDERALSRMMRGASSNSAALRTCCLRSFFCEPSVRFSQQARKTVVEHWESFTHEVELTPLRNIVFPSWIERPLDGCGHLPFLRILLRTTPARLLMGIDAVDLHTSFEKYLTMESPREMGSSQCSTVENFEGNFSGKLQRMAQTFSDGMLSDIHGLFSLNSLEPTEHGQIPGPLVFHGECTTNTTETRSSETPSASSFQELLKSVVPVNDTVCCPEPMKSESSPHPREELHQSSSNDCSRSIPGLDIWERHSASTSDGPTSAAVTCSTDSVSKPVRRRGCPKGGWPKKTKARKNLSFSDDKKDEADVDGLTSQAVANGEADFEVVQPKHFRISNRQDSEFRKKLDTFLDRPFQLAELKDLEEHACLRKPLLRLRETRQRVLQVATNKEGLSYLDYHPDLARKLADAVSLKERLRLLRGFFFWLQHSCTSGSFKPWVPSLDETEESDEDCVEIFPKEEVVHHIYTMASTENATVESRACPYEQRSARETTQTGMTLRTRGQSSKSTLQRKKSRLAKQVKPAMEATVKREEMRRN